VAALYVLNMEDFPLRRSLHCSGCGRGMTGGPSRSHTGKLHEYYRCTYCHIRSLKAEEATNEFLELLGRLRVNGSFESDFAAVLKEQWADRERRSASIVPRMRSELKGAATVAGEIA
jgi:DNA-directed RNA polymerase subunit RPC12/RpoP